jgi:hypothetical protein
MEQVDAQYDQKKKEQAQAVSDIEQALATIEARGPHPDRWERASLLQAIRLLWRAEYTYASMLVDLAMTPVAARSPGQNVSSDPIYDVWGLHTLKAYFADARAQPLRPQPDWSQPLPPFQPQRDG